MLVPLQVTFQNIDPSLIVRRRIAQQAERLGRVHPRIVNCRVVIRRPHRHHRKGDLFEIRIDLRVPGHEISVTRRSDSDHAHGDVYTAIHDAFGALRRRLEDAVRRRQGGARSRTAA